MCCLEFPDLERFQQMYRKRGLVIFGMNASVRQDEPSTLRAFARQTGISFPLLLRADHLFRVYGRQKKMPLEVLIDRQGNVAYMAHRFDAHVLRIQLERLLKAPHPAAPQRPNAPSRR